MLIIGLTGSIGMGKSTAANRFRTHNIPVFDADAGVHQLYDGTSVEEIGKVFPLAIADGKVDRKILSSLVLGKPEQLRVLEDIIHPMVKEQQRCFIAKAVAQGVDMAVLEIPLLFETGLDEKVDVTIVVTTSAEIQRERVLRREGMTVDKLASILANQMPDKEKQSRADIVVDTSGMIEETKEKLDIIIESLRNSKGESLRKWISSDL